MPSLKDLIRIAAQYIGVPYRYGGTTPKGFDCSGYTRYVFAKVGVKLPRTSQDQARSGHAVKASDLSPGDLIFSDWGEGANSHVAIYAGDGKLLEAPRTGKSVQLVALNANYKAHVSGYRRVSSKKGGILDSIEGVAKNAVGGVIIGGESLLGAGADTASDLLKFPSEITGFFTQAASSLESTVNFFAAFFRPSTYVRIGAGFVGFTFLVAGCVFLMLQARES
ncbi:MAG: C40 family peptidase [Catenulispora sp.]